MNPTVLVDVDGVCVDYHVGRQGLAGSRTLRAVDRASLRIPEKSVVSLVGESGSGKTTLGRAITMLQPITAGEIRFRGEPITGRHGRGLRSYRRAAQIVFQDPFSSLDPRLSVFDTVAEPLTIHRLATGSARDARVRELLDGCGLDGRFYQRRPHELSGGQRQRVGIARALAVSPEFLVCDEPVSALDASIQAQILNLLTELKDNLGLTYLFIGHNLGVIKHVSDHVGVMYLGSIVEYGPAETIFSAPGHPYTKALISSAPLPDPRAERAAQRDRIVLRGDIPSPAAPPSGCRFHTRCWLYTAKNGPEICRSTAPVPQTRLAGHWAACHFTDEVTADRPQLVTSSSVRQDGAG